MNPVTIRRKKAPIRSVSNSSPNVLAVNMAINLKHYELTHQVQSLVTEQTERIDVLIKTIEESMFLDDTPSKKEDSKIDRIDELRSEFNVFKTEVLARLDKLEKQYLEIDELEIDPSPSSHNITI